MSISERTSQSLQEVTMQLSGILILALAVAGGFAVPLSNDPTEERMKNLISATDDFLVAQSGEMRPARFPDFHGETPQIPFLGDLIKANVSTTNGLYYGYSSFNFENIRTFAGKLVAQLNIRYPLIGLKGNYELEGEVLGHILAQGAGNFTYEVYNLTMYLNNVELYETEEKALRIRSFGLTVDIESNMFNITGLNLKHLSVETYDLLVELVLHRAFDVYKRPYALAWEVGAVRALNQAIGNRTLEEVVEYLKENKVHDYQNPSSLHEQMITLLHA